MNSASEHVEIDVTVNGSPVHERVEPRLLLSDFLRHRLGLTGTHVGCEQGVCGACTVLIDGAPARSCLTFACQVAGARVETVESLASGDELSPLQEAFREHHGLQCGFCTPGFLMTAQPLLERAGENITDDEIREHFGGNICRCTGYSGIIAAVRAALAQGAAR